MLERARTPRWEWAARENGGFGAEGKEVEEEEQRAQVHRGGWERAVVERRRGRIAAAAVALLRESRAKGVNFVNILESW